MSREANVIRGRIETHGKGLGTPTEEMARRRAREIAITNGRRPEDFNQADLEQARQELESAQNASGPDNDQGADVLVDRPDTLGISTGQRTKVKVPTDEQTLPEDLVSEGVDEAAHERMVEGNRESRRRDKQFEDQLPQSPSQE